MSNLKTVAKNSSLYFLSSLLLRASSIIFFPIFSFYLTRQDYGILFITQSITSVLLSFSGLEIHRSVTRFIHDKRFTQSPTHIFFNGFKITIFSNLIWVGLLLLLGPFILKPFLNDIDFYPYMFYAGLSVIFTSVVDNYRSFLKAQHKGQQSFRFDLAYYGTNIALNLFFVVVLKTDVIGLIYSTLITGILFMAYVFFKVQKGLDWKLERILTSNMFAYALPLVPFTLLGLMLSTTDRFLVNTYIGKETSGIFYLAFTIGTLYSTLKESFYTSFTPWFYQHFKVSEYPRIIEIMNALILFSALICVLLSLFSYELLTLISSKQEFIITWKYVPFICSGFLIVFIGQLISLPIFYSKQNRLFFTSNLGGWVTITILGYFMVNYYGLMGIVAAKMVAFSVMVIIQYYLAKQVSQFRIDRMFALLVLMASFGLSCLHYVPLDWLWLFVLKVTVSLILTYYVLNHVRNKFFAGMTYSGMVKSLVGRG